MPISSNKRGHTHALIKLEGLSRLAETMGRESIQLYIEEFVARLKKVMRSNDRLLKISPAKYCMILHEAEDRHLVELAAAKLVRVFDLPANLLGSPMYFKVRVGFALPSQNASSSSQLVKIAETALRKATAQDQPFLIGEEGDQESDVRDPALLARIHQAVDRGEFLLYYQPKFSAAFRNIVGAEGLVRWHDADEKRIRAPYEFIELAEQDPVIETLTEQLLRIAVARAVHWDSSISVAVNVTPRLLEARHFVQSVADILDVYGFAPPRLTLEVTERGHLPPAAFDNLHAARELGVVISIDDFGTGNCSLSYFRDLPADQIKVDLSFVKAMRTSKKDNAIVRGSIDLAHHCDMQVVAEGVEDEETADLLTEMGCDVLQGYWFDKPLPPEVFEEQYLAGLRQTDEPDAYSDLL